MPSLACPQSPRGNPTPQKNHWPPQPRCVIGHIGTASNGVSHHGGSREKKSSTQPSDNNTARAPPCDQLNNNNNKYNKQKNSRENAETPRGINTMEQQRQQPKRLFFTPSRQLAARRRGGRLPTIATHRHALTERTTRTHDDPIPHTRSDNTSRATPLSFFLFSLPRPAQCGVKPRVFLFCVCAPREGVACEPHDVHLFSPRVVCWLLRAVSNSPRGSTSCSFFSPLPHSATTWKGGTNEEQGPPRGGAAARQHTHARQTQT